MRRIIVAMGLVLLLGAAFTAACGGGGKTVKVPGGEVSVSDKVPDDFPDSFPVPDGADVQGSYTGEQGGVSGTVVTWEVNKSVDDLKTFYDDKLGGDGEWKSVSDGNIGGSVFYSAESKDGKKVAYVNVTEADGKTTLIVIIGDKEDTSTGDGSSGDGSSGGDSSGGDSGDGSGDSTEQPTIEAELPEEVDLDADFPKDDVPLPDGARVTNSSSFTNAGQTSFIIQMYVKGDASDIADDLKGKLEGKGWVESFSSNQNGEYFASYGKGDPATSTMNIGVLKSEVSGYSEVNLTVNVGS